MAKGPTYLLLTGTVSAQNHAPISSSDLLMQPKRWAWPWSLLLLTWRQPRSSVLGEGGCRNS